MTDRTGQRGGRILDQRAPQRTAGPNNESDEPLRFKAVDCRELDRADYSVEFLIHNTLVGGQPAFIGGAPKTLKTLIGLDMAVSLAAAVPFLGVLEAPRNASVVYMTGEGGLSLMQDYSRRVAASKGLTLADVANLVFCDRLPQLAEMTHLDALEALFVEHEAEVLILERAQPAFLARAGMVGYSLMLQQTSARSRAYHGTDKDVAFPS